MSLGTAPQRKSAKNYLPRCFQLRNQSALSRGGSCPPHPDKDPLKNLRLLDAPKAEYHMWYILFPTTTEDARILVNMLFIPALQTMPERLQHRQLIITCFAQIAKGGGMEKLAGTQAEARGPSYRSMAPVEPTIHFIQLRLAAGEDRLCDRAR